MKLLIDDTRDFSVDVIARNGEAGLSLLKTVYFDTVYLDFDLGSGITGFEVLRDGLEHMEKIIIVSTHPSGKALMERFLREKGWSCKDKVLWVRP